MVRFHGCGRWPDPVEGHSYYVMDLVPGLPLDVWAETRNASFLEFARVGAKMALTLGELHGRGVVHRDVKPDNILIREPDGAPVLVDFGIGYYSGVRRARGSAMVLFPWQFGQSASAFATGPVGPVRAA